LPTAYNLKTNAKHKLISQGTLYNETERVLFFNILMPTYKNYCLLCFKFTPFYVFVATASNNVISTNAEL